MNTQKPPSAPPGHDYEYLGDGYYACVKAELEETTGVPTCEEVLDAYIVPIALEKARAAGIPVPKWTFTNGAFEPPAVLYGVNPFARSFAVVREDEDWHEAARRVSRRGKFVICCQAMPAGAQLVDFDLWDGAASDARFKEWAARLTDVFGLPAAHVRLIECADGSFLLSAIERPRTRQGTANRLDRISSAAEEESK